MVVLVLLGGAGWVAYEKRDIIIESWMTPSAPELRTALISDALGVLTTETSADLIQVWSIDQTCIRSALVSVVSTPSASDIRAVRSSGADGVIQLSMMISRFS